ncbi:bifunctional precorrin-2 dehydrogenase/sirohydrochlorin ferrochelatase [Nitratiruptor sp. YY09-18]|uniref:precorrin-2 dehydrogenase/sirohydrochlorin ferrochelatase family protein n=1 Tax=Nitratiruptor sp. YY09-18 TaxID=2724901 RepID=UPI00191533AA|nr:bifunctional precorrin-2 dehydrogenase/sirohydrochlorin ferrochelatase [Nitratiruptor sp. YY09-18]BCD68853.1 precorrin-2 dehydrogenase / sirohydrochlorin ferrochelatase [Nitratiruptor sp. YY09-18]
MGYFPAFLKLQNKKVLIIGGGKIATDKLSHMLDFTKNITIISPDLSSSMQEFIECHNLAYLPRRFKSGDTQGFFLVIVAVDNIEVQKEVYQECQQSRTLCNAVDSVEYCDFIFPSYIKRGDLTIAISTSGASPAFAKYLRRAIEKLLPDNLEEFLDELKNLRKTLPKGIERMQLLDSKAKEFIQKLFKEK